jgi:hypothetical protein
MGSVYFLLKTAIISFNSISELMFVMVESCVLFEVWAEFLNIILTCFGFVVLNTLCCALRKGQKNVTDILL